MKRVFRAASLIQVAHARNVLLTAGIASELRNQYLAGALGDLPMLETWPQLFVEDADEAVALRALARAATAPTGALGHAMCAANPSSRNSRAAGAAGRPNRPCHSLGSPILRPVSDKHRQKIARIPSRGSAPFPGYLTLHRLQISRSSV